RELFLVYLRKFLAEGIPSALLFTHLADAHEVGLLVFEQTVEAADDYDREHAHDQRQQSRIGAYAAEIRQSLYISRTRRRGEHRAAHEHHRRPGYEHHAQRKQPRLCHPFLAYRDEIGEHDDYRRIAD